MLRRTQKQTTQNNKTPRDKSQRGFAGTLKVRYSSPANFDGKSKRTNSIDLDDMKQAGVLCPKSA